MVRPDFGTTRPTSPIASALIGKKVGDKVEVEIPRGKLRMEILGIE